MDFLPKEYQDVIRTFKKHEVNFLLIGGLAVLMYGYKRMTEDMDVLFASDEPNVKRLLAAIEEMGYDTSEVQQEDLLKSIHFRLGMAPYWIDVINETVGIDYQVAFGRAVHMEIEGFSIPVIHINDLIANKEAMNTYKDLADAEELKRIRDRGV